MFKKNKPTLKRDEVRKKRYPPSPPWHFVHDNPAKVGMAENRLATRRAKNKVARRSRKINRGANRG